MGEVGPQGERGFTGPVGPAIAGFRELDANNNQPGTDTIIQFFDDDGNNVGDPLTIPPGHMGLAGPPGPPGPGGGGGLSAVVHDDTLSGDGTATSPLSVTNPNITYTFVSGTDGSFTVTPSDGDAQVVMTGGSGSDVIDTRTPQERFRTKINDASTRRDITFTDGLPSQNSICDR